MCFAWSGCVARRHDEWGCVGRGRRRGEERAQCISRSNKHTVVVQWQDNRLSSDKPRFNSALRYFFCPFACWFCWSEHTIDDDIPSIIKRAEGDREMDEQRSELKVIGRGRE